jgi:mannosyl-3-phosphoglycerate phosphatase
MSRAAPGMVIFTDLDGTLLDRDTYECGEALPALRRCLSGNVPVVFCSSKTRAEIEELRRMLGSADPFISENGGAVFIPRGHFPFPIEGRPIAGPYFVVELGGGYAKLSSTLDHLSRDLEIPVRAFHRMTPEEIARETGLPLDRAVLAAAREYDEPFAFVDASEPDRRRFLRAAEARGLSWTHGGRFYHLLGHAGKRRAVTTLTALYRRWNPTVRTAGLGDSANDAALLAAVDIPILVMQPGVVYDPTVVEELPGVHRSPFPGPRGWNESVQALLAGHLRELTVAG